MKVCKICEAEKELKEFYDNPKSKDKKNSYCKECDKKAARVRYEKIKADPELRAKHNARISAYYAEMRETMKSLKD